MAQSATIDLIKYTAVSETNSQKSYADNKSNDFNNILESANKAFDSESKQEYENKNQLASKDSYVEKRTQDKTDEIKESKKDTSVKDRSIDNQEEKSSEIKDESVTENDTQVKTDEQKTSKTSSKEEAEAQNQSKVADTENEVNAEQSLADKNIPVNVQAQNKADAIATVVLESIFVQADKATSQINKASQLGQASQVNSQSVTGDAESVVVSSVVQNNDSAQEAPQVNQPLEKLLNNKQIDESLANSVDNQVLANNLSKKEENSKVDKELQQQSQVPVIKTSTQVAAAQANTNITTESSQTPQDVLNKMAITQEMIDKTDAKIVKIEKSDSSSISNNLLEKQNASEQGIKMSVEPSVPDNTSFATVVDNAVNAAQKTTTAPQANKPLELNKSDILSQIHSKLDKVPEEGSTKINIILKPENLGKITLELTNGKDGLVAKMTTDNAQVKELLDKNLDSLKDTMSSQGISVNNVSVKVEETQKQSNDNFMFDANSNNKNQQQQGNNKTANQQNAEFDSETESVLHSTDEGEQQIDKSATVQHQGQVDYKV